MRFFVAVLVLALAASAAAQSRRTPALELGRQRVREGRLEEAFDLLREASREAEDARVWRELAEVADRLRLDAVALEAYETYLLRAPESAPDRPEIAGRVRVLRELIAGGRYVLEGEERPELARDPRVARSNILVDWYGRPLVLRRSTGLISLADWDGSLRRSGPERVPDLVPFPDSTGERNLGRRLARPRR